MTHLIIAGVGEVGTDLRSERPIYCRGISRAVITPAAMVFFAIQWGLVVSAIISSITAIRGVVSTVSTMEQFFGAVLLAGREH